MDVKYLHLVSIVQGCTLYYCSAQLNRFEVGHRSHSTCATDLIVYRDEFCEGLLSLELICDCPARELGCISELLLVWQFVYLYDDAVCCERQVLAFCVPIADEFLDFLDAFAYPAFI